LTNP
jgi:hypothetical protein